VTILRDVEVEGVRVDVRVARGLVVEVGPRLSSIRAEEEIDGHGGALLPGLHDHHVHLRATAAARASIDCREGLRALTSATGDRVRGVRSSESVDRAALDALVPDRPVRVQHRSGALWMLNSAALAELDALGRLPDHPDVERDERGRPTGRLWRLDHLLRGTWPSIGDLDALGRELAAYGITGVTDATPDLEETPSVPQAVTLLGRRKLLLHDHDLPTFDDLVGRVSERHASGLPVAVHCVTRESLLLTLAVLDEVGRLPGDRIEHAAVVPDPAALRGLQVVTQPGFLSDRGDDYRRDVAADDLAHLYPFASLLAAGVDAVASSDAPYGPADPWQVVRSACRRDLLPEERVTPGVALGGYLRGPDLGPRRRVRVGEPGALTLLHTSLADALDALDSACVRQVLLPTSS
jgi:predicted amidohydrolase YtcJ